MLFLKTEVVKLHLTKILYIILEPSCELQGKYDEFHND